MLYLSGQTMAEHHLMMIQTWLIPQQNYLHTQTLRSPAGRCSAVQLFMKAALRARGLWNSSVL